jgi:hypothetical protein
VGLRIDRRFRGPDQSANGGYACGLVAGIVGGPAEVTLRGRPPLDRDLAVTVDDSGVRIHAGEEQIATALSLPGIDVEVPEPLGFAEALAASERSLLHVVDIEKHAYPSCFVCGVGRSAGDGLRIFPGPVDGHPGMVAAPWIPDDSLGDGPVDDVFVWSALDCPSGFAWVHLELLIVLGRMSGEVLDRPTVGERCVAVGFPIERDGRKLRAGSALYGEDGRLLGRSVSTWITLGAWTG